MKTAALKEVKAKLSEYCERSQGERVLITKHGKPLTIMIGVEGRTLEDVLTAMNPEFWNLIEQRRRQPTLSSAEMRKRLASSDRTIPVRRAPLARGKGSKSRLRPPATAK